MILKPFEGTSLHLWLMLWRDCGAHVCSGWHVCVYNHVQINSEFSSCREQQGSDPACKFHMYVTWRVVWPKHIQQIVLFIRPVNIMSQRCLLCSQLWHRWFKAWFYTPEVCRLGFTPTGGPWVSFSFIGGLMRYFANKQNRFLMPTPAGWVSSCFHVVTRTRLSSSSCCLCDCTPCDGVGVHHHHHHHQKRPFTLWVSKELNELLVQSPPLLFPLFVPNSRD